MFLERVGERRVGEEVGDCREGGSGRGEREGCGGEEG